MKRFPSELEDVLIDFCHDDYATLASCGLVCRGWLPASRYHLFSSISLSTQNARAFQEILALSATIPALVRDVELHFSGASLLHLQVVPILLLLSHTKRLTLRPVRDEVTRPVCTSSLSCAFTSLHLVHLKFDFKSRFESLKQVIDCVCLCPRLESLEVGGSWQRTGDFAVPPGPRLPKGMHTLTLTCDLDNFLTWLLALGEYMPTIQHLALHHIVRREVEAVVTYLQTCGPTLKSLCLAFRDFDAPGGCPSRLPRHVHLLTLLTEDYFVAKADLAQNTSLRDVALEGMPTGVLSSLLTLLPQLNLCGTDKLALILRYSMHARDLDLVYPWDTLDAEFRFLKRLTVSVVEPLTGVNRRGVAEKILKRLPLTRARGTVTIL
ncbi:hypothetical protein C8R47DRAFT_1267506 [Mycena vitilis]|nr:hypothetical protein C8R47DRAFT_1267506 [Mycena vitilis]